MFNCVTGTGYVQGQKIIPLDFAFDSLAEVNFGLSLELNFAGDTFVVGGYSDQNRVNVGVCA